MSVLYSRPKSATNWPRQCSSMSSLCVVFDVDDLKSLVFAFVPFSCLVLFGPS